MVMFVVEVSVGLMVKFNVATLSQPATVNRFAVYVPAVL
jgi:hypothetical protein